MGIFSEMTETDHEQLVFCYDPVSGLKAIIGIHDTTLGPALGGTRMWSYAREEGRRHGCPAPESRHDL